MRATTDLVVRLSCPECGRRDVLTGSPPPDRTLAELHGWRTIDGRSVCPSCVREKSR
jgi:hypothetical protein